MLALIGVGLVGAVVCAVHHAEVVAHRVGEPFGTLILAIAVTVIEVGLIVSLMVSSPETSSALARDTVFAAIMVVCNGVVGLCLLVGALRHQVVWFRPEGVGGALATLAAVATLGLVLPSFTASSQGPTYTGAQARLRRAGLAGALRRLRVRAGGAAPRLLPAARARPRRAARRPGADGVQHDSRRGALPGDGDAGAADHDDEHAAPPSSRTTWTSLGLLLVCLVCVVGLAKTASKSIEHAVEAVGAPQPVVGVLIAILVLAPETVAALRAARRNRVQTSLNLAIGSALASIGLTIPSIALASIWLTGPLRSGSGRRRLVLLALTLVVSTLTTVTGRATILQGAVHLAIFGSFVFLAFTP
nr:hypothetical protein [Angustibacter aerolatus]